MFGWTKRKPGNNQWERVGENAHFQTGNEVVFVDNHVCPETHTLAKRGQKGVFVMYRPNRLYCEVDIVGERIVCTVNDIV